MRYIGIDLGTTNSAICSFDGINTRIWQSPEQTTVTPSAIYVDRRGNRYYGRRAYEMAPLDEDNAATLFKRFLGTSKVFHFERTGETLTPEDCSAEILQTLYGYLPEDWRGDPETVTVITVPAAFGQVKKDATLEAARKAKLGKVALIQEPVAAVMSAMKEERVKEAFLIYDLGGGTFDVSVAEYMGDRVRLLAQGGKEMCGGRDWDRNLWRTVVLPWLLQHFKLPGDMEKRQEYKRLRQLALFACEKAKISLSISQEAMIQMDEDTIQTKDLDGKEIYLELQIDREMLDKIIRDQLQMTLQVAEEVIGKSGLTRQQIKKIIFIGGPTVYPSLQSKVMEGLKIYDKGTADPMTAVAEGAAIFAESINWDTEEHQQRERIARAEEKDFEIRFEGRCSEPEARIALIHREGKAFSAEVTSERDGWSSGKAVFQGRGVLSVPMRGLGENCFQLRLYDENGQPVEMKSQEIRIQHVLAAVSAVPSSHAIAIKALDQVGGKAVPVYLIQENETLPKRGTVSLRSGIRLLAGSSQAIVFTLWEGEIRDPVDENRYIGTYRIPGDSFGSGVVQAGEEIICEYEINESGNLTLGVTIPSVGAVFANQNYYSRIEGELNLEDVARWMKKAQMMAKQLKEINQMSFSSEMIRLTFRLNKVMEELENEDQESIHHAIDDLHDVQRKLALYSQEHKKEMQIIKIKSVQRLVDQFQDELGGDGKKELEKYYLEAREAVDYDPDSFEACYDIYKKKTMDMLLESGRFLKTQFLAIVKNHSQDNTDKKKFEKLRNQGMTMIENDECEKLLPVLIQLSMISGYEPEESVVNIFEKVNVVRG